MALIVVGLLCLVPLSAIKGRNDGIGIRVDAVVKEGGITDEDFVSAMVVVVWVGDRPVLLMKCWWRVLASNWVVGGGEEGER